MQKPFINNSGILTEVTPVEVSAGTLDGGKIPVTKSTGKFDESLLPFTFPSSTVDNSICRFDGVTGKSVQSSLCSIDDEGKIVIGSNTFSSAFPCQLEVVSSENNIAKFGSNFPIYFRDSDPNIDFNLHYNSGWKFAHEINTSTAYYGALINFNVSSGLLHFYLSSAAGVSGATATLVNLFNIAYNGVYSFGHGTQNILVFPAAGSSAPSFSTRSAGTKLVLYPNISASAVDYAFGIESACLWASVVNAACSYKWYFGTTCYYQFKATECFLPLAIEIGGIGYSGDRNCYIDFHSDDTYTDYGFRIIKYAGANGSACIYNRGTGCLYLYAQDAGQVAITTNNADRMRFSGDGHIYMAGFDSTTAYSYVMKNSSTSELVRYTSSRRWKTDIKDLNFDTSLLYKLRPVNFFPLENCGDTSREEIGFIAEEVAEVHEKFATYGADGLPDGISWFPLVTVMLAEIQKLNKRLEVLENGNKKRNRNRE